MKYLGTGKVKLSQLKVSGKFRERLESDRVKGRAESMKMAGQLQQILVRKADSTLIAGEDRVASLQVAGIDEALCNWWEASDLEVSYLRRMENAERRHDVDERDKSLLQMKEIEVKMALATGAAKTETEAKVIATDKIAKEKGVKPGSVERQERRAKKRLKEAEAKVSPAAEESVDLPVLKDFETHGIDLGPEFAANIEKATGWLCSIENYANEVKTELAGMRKATTVIRPARLDDIYVTVVELMEKVRGAMPASVCLYCKCVPDISLKCSACNGDQFLMAQQMPALDKRLLDMEEQWVVFEGKMTLLSDLADDAGEEDEADPATMEARLEEALLPVVDDGEEEADEEDLF